VPAPEEPTTFPFPGSTYRGPDPRFARLRAECPVARVDTAGGGHAWLVTRHADVRAALEDERFSRAAVYAPGAPRFDGLFQAPPGMIVSLDPPEHTRLRALAELAFSPERIEGMRPRVRELVDGLMDGLAAEGPPADLVAGFAAPLALTVICELLGVPLEDRDHFHTWVRQFAAVDGPEEEALEGRERLGSYMAALVARKREHPSDDVLSALAAARIGDDRLSDEELVVFGYTLLGAGFDSTAGQLALTVLTLTAHHPGTWRYLGEHPERVPAALEELLRTVNLFATDTSGLPRVATEDVAIGDVTVPAGDAVFLAFASANRDETVFPSPDRLDFERADNPHLAFGHGAHRCLGAPLARLELSVAIGALAARFPGLRPAVPENELRWRTGDVNTGLLALPVNW
jgi:cytochrome P450